ncbi:MAG TPA: hypothetical protein VMU40_22305 [Steroidobacteraceae bacterium]|nr:hypothetical protein [Steroidobacteraceae bacterium]
MDTVRVDLVYRPLRICWAIAPGDIGAYRKVVRLNSTFWGGRFNPIVVVDGTEQPRNLIEAFRPDFIMGMGDAPAIEAFIESYRYLLNPFFHKGLFMEVGTHDARAQVLDVHNALITAHQSSGWKGIAEKGVRVATWDAEDPLKDIFLASFGGYPDAADCPIDYLAILRQVAEATDLPCPPGGVVPSEIFERYVVSSFNRLHVHSHHAPRAFGRAGYFLGDGTILEHLVTFWNLRAANHAVLFVDVNHLPRYTDLIPAWRSKVEEMVRNRRFEPERSIAVWDWSAQPSESPAQFETRLTQILGEGPFLICGGIQYPSSPITRAPMMQIETTSQMGILSQEKGPPKLSFAYGNKPFNADPWFHTQHLAASVSFIGGLYGDDHHTLDLPYVPELNEFAARRMLHFYDRLRLEPGRLGIVIDAVDEHASISAMVVRDLFEEIFKLSGYKARLSSSGILTKQLIAQLGGLQGARAFKIPGVRRLVKQYGPTQAFLLKTATDEIKRQIPGDTNFGNFQDIYIEPRDRGEQLTPSAVFEYMTGKGLFRIGYELTCAHCQMSSWVALDHVRQKIQCEMCGKDYDATRQLIQAKHRFRRSGVLGKEANNLGAVPVTLTLQQLETNLLRSVTEHIYSTSLELTPTTQGSQPEAELDFVWMTTGRSGSRTAELILGECKDRGKDPNDPQGGDTITQDDVDRIRKVADALRRNRFDVYVLLSKLAPFTPNEIAAARTLNSQYVRRVILLTPDELEPYHIYSRLEGPAKQHAHGGSAQQLADTTALIYFQDPP